MSALPQLGACCCNREITGQWEWETETLVVRKEFRNEVLDKIFSTVRLPFTMIPPKVEPLTPPHVMARIPTFAVYYEDFGYDPITGLKIEHIGSNPPGGYPEGGEPGTDFMGGWFYQGSADGSVWPPPADGSSPLQTLHGLGQTAYFSSRIEIVSLFGGGTIAPVYYGRSSRFRTSFAHTGFFATADVINTPLNPDIPYVGYTYSLAHVALHSYFETGAQEWQMVPLPTDAAGGFPADNTAVFGVIGETPEAWSARTGIPIILPPP